MGRSDGRRPTAPDGRLPLPRPIAEGPGGVATGAGAAAGKRLIEMCRARDATAG